MSIFDQITGSLEGYENLSSSEFMLPISVKESKKSKAKEGSKL